MQTQLQAPIIERNGEVTVLSDFQRRPGRTQVGPILQVVSNLPMHEYMNGKQCSTQ
jgi:hypothetical protein